MCFVNEDYDWIARVNDRSTYTASKPTRCDECGDAIAVGEVVHHVHQQEYEECQVCEEESAVTS